MAKLPTDLSGRQVRAALERAGFVFRRQRGSHMILTKSSSMVSLSIPDHRELAPGTLRKLIRSSGLSVEQFSKACRE